MFATLNASLNSKFHTVNTAKKYAGSSAMKNV